MIKAVAKIVLYAVCVAILLAIVITALIGFTNAKRDSQEYWGGYGLPTEFHDH